MEQRDIRRLLVIGETAVIRWASRWGAPKGLWLARMLERKPVPVVAVVLANKMARGSWAMLTRGEKLSRSGADRRLTRRRTGTWATELSGRHDLHGQMIDMIAARQTRNLLRAPNSLLEMWTRSAHHHPGQRRHVSRIEQA